MWKSILADKLKLIQPQLCIKFFCKNTPNANMAHHSVGARAELHGDEASQALVFFILTMLPQKSLGLPLLIWSVFLFGLPYAFCLPECHQKRMKSFTA